MRKLTFLVLNFMIAAGMASGQSSKAAWSDPLTSFNAALWQKSNWPNGAPFGCFFNPANIGFSEGGMELTLNNTSAGGYKFSGAEYRTVKTYSFGVFQVQMKAAAGSGMNSSFFTYTSKPVWDEIDFEVLGKDTTKVQLNYFVNGAGGHEKIINLGFDASEAFHTYKIEYGSGFINWYVDGVLVYGVNNESGAVLPSHPMQLMMNLWNGDHSVDAWLGSFNYTVPLHSYYSNFSYSPAGN